MASGNSHIRVDVDTRPMAQSTAALRATAYAAKFRADTMSQEPPVLLESTDENLAEILGRCVRPARPDEYPAIRAALASWQD